VERRRGTVEGVDVTKDFWSGKRVLITGHTGFKGSWLSIWLSRLGADVTGYALQPPSRPSLFEEARVSDTMNSVIGDIRDLEEFRRQVNSSRPEIVFHLAAQSLVRKSYEEPLLTFMTNVMGTAHVLEAVREAPSVRAILVVTSDKVYENQNWLWGYRENDLLGGHDPYSSSKACAELVALAYRRSFYHEDGATRVVTARAGNVIGGGDWAEDRLVPDLARSLQQSGRVRLRNPSFIRPWQHVLDPLHGYLLLAEALYEGQSDLPSQWNFGPDAESHTSVLTLASRLMEHWGINGVDHDEGEHPAEAATLGLDSSRARRYLGWRPHLGLEPTIEKVADWYRSFHSGMPAYDLVTSDIQQFEEECAC
jgi:CDP-glucose 4,6-dehydratase